jgi:hypothetical protein
VTQKLTLMSNGQVVAAMTDSGEVLDGTPAPCRASTEQFPQSAINLPFGPAALIVEGDDAANHPSFSRAFDVFVGAGISNPTITYDLPAPPPADAGVDSM